MTPAWQPMRPSQHPAKTHMVRVLEGICSSGCVHRGVLRWRSNTKHSSKALSDDLLLLAFRRICRCGTTSVSPGRLLLLLLLLLWRW